MLVARCSGADLDDGTCRMRRPTAPSRARRWDYSASARRCPDSWRGVGWPAGTTPSPALSRHARPRRIVPDTAVPRGDTVDDDRRVRGSVDSWRSSTFRVVLLSTLLSPFSVALVSPGLPVFRIAFGTTGAGASLLLSAILVLGILLSPLVGLLTDRLGRRRTLVSSLVAWSLAGGLVVLRPSFPVVLALRLVQGAALAGIGVTTVTLIGDTFEGVQRNEVLGVNTAVLSAGAAAFPVVGGALVVVSWSAPFAMYLLGLPVAVLAFLVLEEPLGERESRSLVYLRRVVFALSAREAVVPYGSAFVIDFLLFGAVFTGLPFLLAGTCGLSPVLIGLVVTTGEVASTVAATQNDRFARHLSDYGIITVGFVATAAGLVGAGLTPTPLPVALATLGFGAGWGLALPSIDAGVSELVPTRFRAGVLSLRRSASFVGRVAGPIVFAALAVGSGYRVLLLLAGLAALVSVVALLFPMR